MRIKSFQSILGLLSLLGVTYGSIVSVSECTTKAWVRAPDLTPGAIVHGDTRVKISAGCPTIENVSLGLRFKERSFVKALRSQEEVERLNPEPAKYDLSNVSPWTLRPTRFANKSVEEAYEKFIANKTLWIVQEEARVVFETTQPIDMGNGDHDALRDVVQDFSILVPSTNFPPVPVKLRGSIGFPTAELEAAHAEWSYEYFAQIFFSDGTTEEIIAGYTAFQPLYDPASDSRGPTSATARLKPFHDTKQSPVNYSIEVTADSGLTFFTGTKNQVITVVVTRTGLPRTFLAPLNATACLIPDSSPKWAIKYNINATDANGFPASRFQPTSVLRATSYSDKRQMNRSRGRQCSYGPKVTVSMPNSTSDEIQANETVTTTSAPFTISIDVADAHIPTFETHYETLANLLTFTLEWREDEDIDPDDPSRGRNFNWGPQFEDDEEAWVPWERMDPPVQTWRSYLGHVPAVVHPTREGTASQCYLGASTDISAQKVLSDETGCEQRSLVHYLDEGARGPTFVDREAVYELLTADPAQRDLRAPILEPMVSSVPEGEERVYRYYGRPNIYVGETWAKKVTNKDRY